jgi:hypothetical protein
MEIHEERHRLEGQQIREIESIFQVVRARRTDCCARKSFAATSSGDREGQAAELK